MDYLITVADSSHHIYATAICNMMAQAALVRGTGIAQRDPDYVSQKMTAGDAIIALINDTVIGFCYIESWEDQKYVANSGLITHPDYRNIGLAKAIKKSTFELSKKKFPDAKLFGITTSMAVMKINSRLGYEPVSFSELTKDEKFWNGCKSCVNYDVLTRTNRTMCMCTGMICDLSKVNYPSPKSAWFRFTEFIKGRKSQVNKSSRK